MVVVMVDVQLKLKVRTNLVNSGRFAHEQTAVSACHQRVLRPGSAANIQVAVLPSTLSTIILFASATIHHY